jgi:hypothetical protein
VPRLPALQPGRLFSDFTALPIQIFVWTQDPDRSFVTAARGHPRPDGILLMNSVAIYCEPLRAEVVDRRPSK